MWRCALLLVSLMVAACGQDSKPAGDKAAAAKASPGGADGFVGVDPSVFECETVVPQGEIAQAVGGAVEPMESMFQPPRGTPKPCDYIMVDPPEIEVQDGAPMPAQMLWSVRFDCREDRLAAEEQEMQRLMSTDGATRVEVGKWGIDARGSALIFLDDDAPCSVRVIGPGDAQRLAIAGVVARHLTPDSAPMRPRAAQ